MAKKLFSYDGWIRQENWPGWGKIEAIPPPNIYYKCLGSLGACFKHEYCDDNHKNYQKGQAKHEKNDHIMAIFDFWFLKDQQEI